MTHDVYRTGDGPAVIVLPEVPGLTPAVADLARRLRDAGFTAVVPSLFGDPGRSALPPARRTTRSSTSCGSS